MSHVSHMMHVQVDCWNGSCLVLLVDSDEHPNGQIVSLPLENAHEQRQGKGQDAVKTPRAMQQSQISSGLVAEEVMCIGGGTAEGATRQADTEWQPQQQKTELQQQQPGPDHQQADKCSTRQLQDQKRDQTQQQIDDLDPADHDPYASAVHLVSACQPGTELRQLALTQHCMAVVCTANLRTQVLVYRLDAVQLQLMASGKVSKSSTSNVTDLATEGATEVAAGAAGAAPLLPLPPLAPPAAAAGVGPNLVHATVPHHPGVQGLPLTWVLGMGESASSVTLMPGDDPMSDIVRVSYSSLTRPVTTVEYDLVTQEKRSEEVRGLTSTTLGLIAWLSSTAHAMTLQTIHSVFGS